jgi:Preprotein translocase subunit YidC
METVQKMQAEQKKLYAEAGVNPFASMLPMIVQLPVIYALYQAIWRTDVLRAGSFMWLQLGHPRSVLHLATPCGTVYVC